MAKRRSPAASEPQSDPFDADIADLNLDDLNVDDLRVEDVPDEEIDLTEALADSSTTRPPLSPGQLVGGFFQVIIGGALIFALMAAIGFGVVFAGQQLGVVPTRSAGESGPTIAGAPTSAAPEVVVVPTATPLPAVTADPSCSQADAWWDSQQVQSNITYFTEQVMELARTSNNIAALTEQMRIHRDFVDNFPADLCLNEAKAALLKAFDSTIAVARAVNARDDAALALAQPAETQAYADLATILRDVGINFTPPAASG